MVLLPSVLFGGALLSPPALVFFLIVVLVVLVIGRMVLALAWRLVWIALAVVFVLWLLGALGVSLF